jgi:ribose transport system permease protein
LIVPAALSGGNIANVAQAVGPLVIMALGMPLVIVKGDLGLSVGSVFSLTRMVSGVPMSDGYGAVPADSRPVW